MTAGVALGIAGILEIVRRLSGLTAAITVAVTVVLVYVTCILTLVATALDVTGIVALVRVNVIGFSYLLVTLVTGIVTSMIEYVVDLSGSAAAVTDRIAIVLPHVAGVGSEKSALVTLDIALVIPLVRDLIGRESGSSANVTVGIASIVVSVRRSSLCTADVTLLLTGSFPVGSNSYVSTACFVTGRVANVGVLVLDSSSFVTTITVLVTVVIILMLGSSLKLTNVTVSVAIVVPGVRSIVIGIAIVIVVSYVSASSVTLCIAVVVEDVSYVSLISAIGIVTRVVTVVVKVVRNYLSDLKAYRTVSVTLIGIGVGNGFGSCRSADAAGGATGSVVLVNYLIISLVSAEITVGITTVVVVVRNVSLGSANVTFCIALGFKGVRETASLHLTVGIVTYGVAAVGIRVRGNSGLRAVVTVAVTVV